MKYINLEEGTYTSPVTGKKLRCKVDYPGRWHLYFYLCADNALPFADLCGEGCSNDDIIEMKKKVMHDYNLHPFCGVDDEASSPEFENSWEAIRMCSILNDLLTKKYSGFDKSETIKLDFD